MLHASANQITFATGKLTYAEALEHFGHLRESLLADPILAQLDPAFEGGRKILSVF